MHQESQQYTSERDCHDTANNASISLQLNLLKDTTITSYFLKKFRKTFLYHNGSLVNKDFGKIIKKHVNLKNDVKTVRIITNFSGFIPN
jgi:hypothetical protein